MTQTLLKLTDENYFSPEANWQYMSVSQYKDFVGTMGKKGCEAYARAKLKGEWVEEPSTAMLVGSYVDAHFEGTLDIFRAKNPQLFKKDMSLKAEYVKAEEVIARIEKDEFFMNFMSGEKQTILTAELFGIQWKTKLDSYHREKCIVDLKVVKDLRETKNVADYGKLNFIEFWGYDTQGAVYQAIEELNSGNDSLPFFIAAADKTKSPDIEIIGIPQTRLDEALASVQANINRVIDVKAGNVEPDRCGTCDYCKSTKVLSEIIPFDLLTTDI